MARDGDVMRTVSSDLSCRETELELPCIWVLAGVLNYRLCDRFYECEGCELFHALGGGGMRAGRRRVAPASGAKEDTAYAGTAARSASGTEEHVTAHLCHLLGDCRLYLDRHYRPPHFWLLEDGGDEVRVGVADHVLRILSPIDDIITPRAGLHLTRDQPCGWITHNGRATSLAMPISGVVSAVNTSSQLSELARPDAADSWLFRVRPSESLSEIEDLLRGEEMLLWYLDSIRTLKRYMREAVSTPADEVLGAVMADGGAPEPCLEDVLGRGRYERLLREIA